MRPKRDKYGRFVSTKQKAPAMSVFLLAGVALVYGCVAVSEYRNGRLGMSIAFLGWATSNLGLIWTILP